MIATQTHTEIVLRGFEAQQRHVATLKQTGVQERVNKLKKLRAAILKWQHEIAEAIFKDFKKPASETLLTEIFPTLSEIKHTIDHLPKWAKPHKVSMPLVLFGTSSKIVYEPKGVALIIAPWNYPFHLAISPLVYAIAAGNCAIIKPSELSPNTSRVIAEMIKETFEAHEITVFEGDVSVSSALLDLPFNHIFFTGSPAVGKVVMRAAANHLASVTLELGGKSPAIVDETANLQDTAEKLVWGKFINNGQTCVAPDYVLVKSNVREDLLAAIKIQIEKNYNGEGKGIKNSDNYARIISDKHFARLSGMIQNALEKGANLAIGGKVIAEERFIEPTVLVDVTPDMDMMKDEIFGPLLPVLSYDNLKQAIDFINAGEKPLALYMFTTSSKNSDTVVNQTSAGGTCINDCLIHLSHPELPFGGVNNSGIGKTHGFFGFEAFSNARPVLKQRVGLTSIKTLYPPYTNKVKKMIALMMKYFA